MNWCSNFLNWNYNKISFFQFINSFLCCRFRWTSRSTFLFGIRSESGFFDVVLPKTKWNLKCRALTGQDEKVLLKTSEIKKNSSDGDSFLIEQLKMFIVSINGVSDRQMILSAINAMPASDSKFLRSTYQNTVKGIDMKHTFACSKCDYEGELEVPLTVDFFWFK